MQHESSWTLSEIYFSTLYNKFEYKGNTIPHWHYEKNPVVDKKNLLFNIKLQHKFNLPTTVRI